MMRIAASRLGRSRNHKRRSDHFKSAASSSKSLLFRLDATQSVIPPASLMTALRDFNLLSHFLGVALSRAAQSFSALGTYLAPANAHSRMTSRSASESLLLPCSQTYLGGGMSRACVAAWMASTKPRRSSSLYWLHFDKFMNARPCRTSLRTCQDTGGTAAYQGHTVLSE